MTQIVHSVTGKVIDVPDAHAQMLKTQGWKDYLVVTAPVQPKEIQHEDAQTYPDQDAEAEAQCSQEEVLNPAEVEKVAPKRGRPKKAVQIDNEVV